MRARLTATVLDPWETEDLQGLMQTYWAHDPAPADWDNAREELIHRGVDPERWRPRTATVQPMVFDLPADANKLSGATAPIRVKGYQQGEIQITPIGWQNPPDIQYAVVTQIRVNDPQTIGGPLSGRAVYEITLNDGTVLTQSYRVQGTFTPNISKTAAAWTCESLNSWAWIDPDGKFIPVDDHATYAWGVRDQKAVFDRFMRDDAVDYGPYAAVFAKRILEQGLLGDDPPNLISGYAMSIPKDIQIEAAKHGFPNLSLGMWGLRVRLTPQEEQFLAKMNVYPEQIRVAPNNSRNQRIRGRWKYDGSAILTHLLHLSQEVLLDAGWVKVSSAYAIGSARGATDIQYDTFFREVLKCWTKHGIRPDLDRELFTISIGTTWHDMTYAEALDRFAHRRLVDMFYGHLMVNDRRTLPREFRIQKWEDADWDRLMGIPQPPAPPPRSKRPPQKPRDISPPKPKQPPPRYPYRPRYGSMHVAAKGLYGFPASIEKTATVATRQLAREASKIAHAAMNRDAGVIEFLKVHANREDSKSAKVLLAALRETLPRVAAAAEKGMYGHKARTAKFGIQACADVRMAAGRIAASLHDRKENEHERITSFLKTHATEGGCAYSDMIVSCYPDAPKQEKTANAPVGVRGWLSLLDD